MDAATLMIQPSQPHVLPGGNCRGGKTVDNCDLSRLVPRLSRRLQQQRLQQSVPMPLIQRASWRDLTCSQYRFAARVVLGSIWVAAGACSSRGATTSRTSSKRSRGSIVACRADPEESTFSKGSKDLPEEACSKGTHRSELLRRSAAELLSALVIAECGPREEAALAEGGGWPTKRLRGCHAVVTGASSGIGKGIAIALGECGATVYVTGRRAEALDEVARLVTQAGGRGVPFVCDHSKDEEVMKVFQDVKELSEGELHVLVNNAFQAPDTNPEIQRLLDESAMFYDLPISVWDDMHNVGLRSHYVSSWHAAPMMVKTAKMDGPRPLLCVTSSFGGVAPLFTPAYGVGKAACDRMVRDLQLEMGPQGVDCVSFWPGLVLTERLQQLLIENPQRISRLAGGQDVYRVAESPILTGRVLARLAEDASLRKPPYITPDGLTGRVCIVAEAARALGVMDGGAGGSVAGSLYGLEREAAPSIRSLGFLVPGPLKQALPDGLKWIAEPSSPLANYDITLPLEFMAQGPPPQPQA